MTRQSKALQLADELEKYEIFCPDLDEVAAELRRLDRHELALGQWLEKTQWVQDNMQPGELGMHRADGLKQRIDRLTEVNQELLHWLRYIQVQTHIGHIHDTCSAAIAKGETT